MVSTAPGLLTVAHLWSIGTHIHGYSNGLNNVAAAAWPSANLAIFVPFHLPETLTLTRIFWANGNAVSGNVDMGIYDAAGTRLVSTGSTAQTTVSTLQGVAVSTSLAAGTYYFGLAMDNTTGRTERWTFTNLGLMKATGAAQAASSFPLPASVTYATVANNYLPNMGLSIRTTAP